MADHECTEVAGEMAFDFSFSIFPAALFAAALAGFLGVTPALVNRSLDVMGILATDMVREMVEDNIRSLASGSSGQMLGLGFLGAVWASSSAISATIKALNRAYGIRETRSFWHRRLLSIGLMVGVGLAMAVSFNLLIMGRWMEMQVLRWAGLEEASPTLVYALKWPLGFLGVIGMACLIYRIAPNGKPKLVRVLPGAVLFSVLWFFLSRAFGDYVGNFSYYNKVNGVLGVFIVLNLWIYLTALLLLVGGELNAELAQVRGSDA